MQVLDEDIEVELLDLSEVSSNKDNFDEIFRRLKLVEDALNLQPAVEATKGFFARKWEWIINHRGTSIILAIVLCLVGIFGGGYFKYYLDHKDEQFNTAVDKRIRLELEKPDGVLKALQNIQQIVNKTQTQLDDLSPFIHDVVQHQFESASKLPTATLQERLPAIQHLLATAKDQGVKADAKVLDALTQKLSAANTGAIGFWPTAAEFISYRSQSTITNLQSLLRLDIKDCIDKDPTPMKVIDVSSDRHTMHASSAYYDDCRLTLDSPRDSAKINDILGRLAAMLTFRHCLIIYRGGPINLIPEKHNRPSVIIGPDATPQPVTVDFENALRFENCLFSFLVPNVPPAAGQRLTTTLLAENGPNVTFPLN
jgi:hypothetical protein